MPRKIKIDNAILKRRQYQKRTHKEINIICSILIVCEGEKTEPNYFKSFNKQRYGTIVYELTFDGGGISTTKVVEKAIKLRDEAIANRKPFDRVWAVFDKDSFPAANFNTAIKMAKDNNIECAWSNEAFELWYLLHFVHRTTPMERTEYKNAISDAVNKSVLYKNKVKYVYAKNDRKNFDIMGRYGNQSDAIHRAKSLEKDYSDFNYAKQNPCTTVYRLVEQLTGKDKVLNEEIIEKANEQ